MDVGVLARQTDQHVQRMLAARAAVEEEVPWYRYDILANLLHLDALLTGPNRDLNRLAQGMPVADIGAADGDLAFTLEKAAGWEVDIIDNGATSENGLRGARLLKESLGSKVQIHEVDLDTQFELPRESYGLVLFLGILYHLQNPYFVLRKLTSHSRHLLLSTRVARYAGPRQTPVADLPMAYLLAAHEANNDPTNYWIFTLAGLERLVDRTGWEIIDRYNVGNTGTSEPTTAAGDERMFLLLRNRLALPASH